MMNETRKRFSCGKCGFKPEKWERTENEESHFKCSRCGKEHFHFSSETVSKLIPVDKDEEELQHVFITATGRKIHGIDRVKDYLRDTGTKKVCKRCGTAKSDSWRYHSNPNYDIQCPECSQRFLEDTRKLIPVDENGSRQNVMTDAEGNTYIGDEEIQKGLSNIKEGKE